MAVNATFISGEAERSVLLVTRRASRFGFIDVKIALLASLLPKHETAGW